MPQHVTWRLNKRRLELSLWPHRPAWMGIAMLVSGLLAIDGLAVGLAGWLAAATASGSAMGLAAPPLRYALVLAISVGILATLIPAVLWQRFGCERVIIQPGRLRIEHDFRLFKRVRLERRFVRLEAATWTDLERNERGWLLLKLDEDRIRTRVALERPVLTEAVSVVQSFVDAWPGQDSPLYAVHHN